jgi:hypothetical protein
MNTLKTSVLGLVVLLGLLMGACAPITINTDGNVDGNFTLSGTESEFVGVIEEINTDSWVVSSLRVVFHEDTFLDGPFAVGDAVLIRFVTADDGTLVMTEAEHATALDNANGNLNANGNVNGNSNSNGNTNSNGNDNDNDNGDDDDDNSGPGGGDNDNDDD